jgi:hypothetical protein
MEWEAGCGRRAAKISARARANGSSSAAAAQSRKSRTDTVRSMERTPPDLGFGTVLLDSVWKHQGMVGALLSQQYGRYRRWSAAAITS